MRRSFSSKESLLFGFVFLSVFYVLVKLGLLIFNNLVIIKLNGYSRIRLGFVMKYKNVML